MANVAVARSIALITGSSSGIGLLTAVELARGQVSTWSLRSAKLGAKLLDGTSVNRERGEKMRERVWALPKKDPIVSHRPSRG